MPETQELMVEPSTSARTANNITADVELIHIKEVNTAFERIEKSDVKYRFVIDMATI